MGFEFKKDKQGHNGDSMWTSYSDLFLGLSIVFLLLYVTASLKQGTDGIKQHFEYQKVMKENADLKQQIQAYETLKKDYLNKQASNDEQQTYEELMGKLDLLQENATDEKNKLQAQAHENEKKAQALNKYQQLIRNIINSNMVAKSRIKNRDSMIDDKEQVISEKSQEIKGLEQTVATKKQEVQLGEAHIASLENNLEKRIRQLHNSYKSQKITKQKYEKQQEALRRETENKVLALREKNSQIAGEIAKANQELQTTASKLNATENQLNTTQSNLAKAGQENEKLQGELGEADAKHQAEIGKLRGEFDVQKGREKAAFEARLSKERLNGDQKAAREAAFKAQAEGKAKALEQQVAALDGKYRASQGELAKANENLNARRKLATGIAKNFASRGVKAEVDDKTGDVMLSFGDQYFGNGQSNLKPGMTQILDKAVPAYSQSLFSDPKIASKIQSVEIVGFASPTYKGAFVNPSSLDRENRQAINYNLDLSYARARSIFNYVFDKQKMDFKYQQQLLPLVKVTGRSFLSSDKTPRDPASQGSAESFCRSNDCAKLQRVIIKFTLKD